MTSFYMVQTFFIVIFRNFQGKNFNTVNCLRLSRMLFIWMAFYRKKIFLMVILGYFWTILGANKYFWSIYKITFQSIQGDAYKWWFLTIQVEEMKYPVLYHLQDKEVLLFPLHSYLLWGPNLCNAHFYRQFFISASLFLIEKDQFKLLRSWPKIVGADG